MNCHICDEVTKQFIDEKTNITYYHCHACEYIFKSSECYQELSVQKKRYDLHENDENDEGYIAYFQRFLDFVLPQIDIPQIALDFGCGATSLLSKMLEDKGIKCDYYDPIYHPIILDKNNKYNLIVSTEVFEHLHQPREVFESLLTCLEKGGYLAIQTQFHTNNSNSFKKWYYHKDPTHIAFFTVKTFKVLCKLYGCELVKDNDKNIVLICKV